MFCGRHLLAAKLRPANIDASAGATEEIARIVTPIRARLPRVRILLRADSGFARNARLVEEIKAEMAEVDAEAVRAGGG